MNSNFYPNNEAFIQFLSKCKVLSNRTIRCESLSPEYHQFNDESGKLTELYLQYPDGDLGIESIIKKTEKIFRSRGCPTNTKSLICFLAIIVASSRISECPVFHANNIFNQFQEYQFDFSIISNVTKPSDYDIILDKFITLGAFKPEPFLHYSKIGLSDFKNPKIETYRNKYSLTMRGKKFSCPLLDFNRLRKTENNIGALIVEYFFHNLKRQLIAESWQILDEKLAIKEALSSTLDFKNIFTRESFIEQTLGLFRWRRDSKQESWAVRSKPQLYLTLPKKNDFDEFHNRLKKETGFDELTKPSLFKSQVISFSSFLQRASRHSTNGRFDEAFLFCIIGLDLLFGESQRTTETIAERISVLVHKQLNLSHSDAKNKVKKLYDLRSRFVHDGIKPEYSTFDDLWTICHETLFCLLTISASKDLFYNKFSDIFKILDLFFLKMECGEELKDNDWRKIGVTESSNSGTIDKLF